MTARESSRAGSHNSDSRPVGSQELLPEHDVRPRRIVAIATESGATTTRKDLLAKTSLTPESLDAALQALADEGYIELIGHGACEGILLTCLGEDLVGDLP